MNYLLYNYIKTKCSRKEVTNMRKMTRSEMQNVNGGWTCGICGKKFKWYQFFAMVRCSNSH